jgi:hypothetical protein
LFKQKSSVDEIYEIFERCGVLKKELDEWLNEIELDRPRTEKAITDLFFCYFIKRGFNKKHVSLLSERLGHRVFRANHLTERINYLTDYVVKKDVDS